MKKKAIAVLFLPVLFLLAACLASNEGYSSTGYDSTFEETAEFSSILEVTETSEPVHFRGIIYLDKGSCSLVITKPGGEIAREYSFDSPGQKNLIADFNAVKGKWKMELTSNKAEGRFKLQWDNKREDH